MAVCPSLTFTRVLILSLVVYKLGYIYSHGDTELRAGINLMPHSASNVL